MHPVHNVAAKIFKQTQSWASEFKELDPRFQFFALGSIFRDDFDPKHSDLDLVAVVNSTYEKTVNDAVQVVRDLREALDKLNVRLRKQGLKKTEVSLHVFLHSRSRSEYKPDR